MQAKTQVKIPVKVRIWRSVRNYVAVINDETQRKLLKQYVGWPIEFEINGITIHAKLVTLKQRSLEYIGVFLPRRLTPTWEKLRQRAEEHDAVIIITEEGETP
jgi:hypothetical protein